MEGLKCYWFMACTFLTAYDFITSIEYYHIISFQIDLRKSTFCTASHTFDGDWNQVKLGGSRP